MSPFRHLTDDEALLVLDKASRVLETAGSEMNGSGTLGQLRDAHSFKFDRKGFSLYRPTPLERSRSRAWHDYWDEHRVIVDGEPRGYATTDEQLMAAAPPPPESRDAGTWITFTWAVIRAELGAAAAPALPEQLDLFAEAVA